MLDESSNVAGDGELVLDSKAMEVLKSVQFRETASARQHHAWVQRNKRRHYVDIKLLCDYADLPEAKKDDVRLITLTAVRTFCLGVYKVDILNEGKQIGGTIEEQNEDEE
jgi:hypothetical protein